MKGIKEDTPPSSINGDDISALQDDEIDIVYMDDDIDLGEEYMDQYEDDERDEMTPPLDQSALTFARHFGSVFCCNIHPNGLVAVTGGEDDKAFVWSVDSGEVVMECGGHRDSVTCVGFSFDGAYLATADMGGLLKFWKCLDPEIKQHWEVVFEYEADDLSFGLWHFGTRVFICGTVAGDIFVFKVPSGDTKVLQGHNSKVECAKLFQDGVRLAAGYEDGSLKIWDLKTSTPVHHIPSETHEMPITDLDIHPDGNLVSSISSDGKVFLTAATNGKVVGELDATQDLETVAFSKDPQMPYLALGTLKGDLSIWDTTRKMVRHNCSKSSDAGAVGITKMLWIKGHLVTGCLDGSIRIYDGRSGEQKRVLTGHRSEILDISCSSQNNIILSVSDDNTAKIFKYDYE